MKTVLVSSSSKFANQWEKIKLILEKEGIKVFLPSDVTYDTPEKQIKDASLKRKVMGEYFKIIDKSDVFYLLTPNGYNGISSAVEAGYAYAKGKEIISSEEVIDIGIKPLVSKVLKPKELANYLGII